MARDSWLKRLIWLRGSPAGGSGASYEKTVGPAPILSISDAKPKPAKSLIVGMEPIQDLHGYDNPWPAGGGVNKFACGDAVGVVPSTGAAYGLIIVCDGETETVTVSGTPTWSSAGVKSFRLISTRSGSYYGNAPVTHDYSGMSCKWFVVSSSQNITNIDTNPLMNSDGTIGIALTNTDTEAVSIVLRLCVYEGDTSPAAWTPYSNECPITGRTGVTVERTGKNLLSDGTVYKNGNQYTVGATSTREYPFFLKAGTYTASNAGTASYMYWQLKDTSLNNIIHNASTTVGTFTLSQDGWYRFWFYTADADPSFTNIQLEVGSTASDYSAYSGASYPATWQSEAGTVYGGTVDLVSGELTVTHGMVDLGTLTWTLVGSYAINRFDAVVPLMTTSKATPYSDGIFCSAYNPSNVPITQVNVDATIARYSGRVFVCDSAYSDAASFTSGVSGVQLCYKLATPQTYQLTPQQIQLLKGSNVLWSDADDLTLTYIGTQPANLLGGMLGNPQEPTEETSDEPTEGEDE